MSALHTMSATDLIALASSLEDGASADIWYDAAEYADDDEEDPDNIAANQIEAKQSAMVNAAAVLRALAAKEG